jgi:hypothetical protein
MKMVIPNEGKLLWLYWALVTNGGDLEDFVLKGYSNNYTPVDASTAANFTESLFTGYAAIDIDRADMNNPGIVANVAISTCSFVPQWTCTGGAAENLYGWFLVGAVSGKVLAAQRFDNVRVMASGATESINPFQISFKTFT